MIAKRRPGARTTALPDEFAEIINDYAAALADTPLSAESRRTYLSRVRIYLAWLAGHRPTRGTDNRSPTRKQGIGGARLPALAAAQRPITRSVVYANPTLTAIDDFYTRLEPGRATIDRDELPATAPRAPDEQARIRWLRAVEAPRDRGEILRAAAGDHHQNPELRQRYPVFQAGERLRGERDEDPRGKHHHLDLLGGRTSAPPCIRRAAHDPVSP